MLPFSLIVDTLKNLRVPDAEMLKRGALAPLAKKFEAYPVLAGGQRLCVLLPIGMKPSAAHGLDEAALAGRVVVLTHQAGKWTKVWPTGTITPPPAAKEPSTDELSIEFEE